MRKVEQPTIDEHGSETHPAFGVVVVTPGRSTPGASLFQSDLLHSRTLTLTVHEANRTRSLNSDWVHPGKPIVEIEMSRAQWAAVVSSVGDGGGTPVTVRRDSLRGVIPALPYEPRTAESRREVHEAVEKTLSSIREKFNTLNRLEEEKAGVKERRAARRDLEIALGNASVNAVFAVTSMEKAAEKIVQQAQTDIETIIHQAAQRNGLDAASILAPLLSTGPLGITQNKNSEEN